MEEDVVEGHLIHLFHAAGVLRNHRTWKVAEGLVKTREEGDLIMDRESLEEDGVSFCFTFLGRVEDKHVSGP